jgi:hypothetical protein
MSFKFACPHCGQRIGATVEDVGTLGGCPRCQQQFVVPSPPDPFPAPEIRQPTPEPAVTPEVAAPEPEIEPITKRCLAVIALVLSILPVINLVALGLAIFAVVRSDRPGRSGERGLAIAVLVVAGLLLIPINLAGIVAVTSPLLFKSAAQVPDFKPKAASPTPAPTKTKVP